MNSAEVAAGMVAIDDWLEAQAETDWRIAGNRMCRAAKWCVLSVHPFDDCMFVWYVERMPGWDLLNTAGVAPTVADAVAEAEHMAAFWQPAADRGADAREGVPSLNWVDGDGELQCAFGGLTGHVIETGAPTTGWVWFVWPGGGERVASGFCRTAEQASRLAELVIREELA